MKLLLITAIAEFEKEVKQILKNAQVKSYSYKEVKGYRNASKEAIEPTGLEPKCTKMNPSCFMFL